MPTVFLVSLLFLLGLTGGCGQKATQTAPAAADGIAVLTLAEDIPEHSDEKTRELTRVLQWLDRDLVKILGTSGFRPILIEDMQEYNIEMGKLLIVNFERFNPGRRGGRTFFGFGGGAASLDLQFKLLDERGALLAEWRDGAGSSKGATYCAETLNRRALKKIVAHLNR